AQVQSGVSATPEAWRPYGGMEEDRHRALVDAARISTARGAEARCQTMTRSSTKPVTWSLTDGQRSLGHVELRGEYFCAIGPDHRVLLGKFTTLASAMDALRNANPREKEAK